MCAQEATAQATFTTSNGTMDGNTLTASDTPSASEGSDWVRATYNDITTDADHDCDLTVCELEILQPSEGDDFDISQSNCTTTPNITFQGKLSPTDLSANIAWALDLEYQTSAGHGAGTNQREFATQNLATHAETYASMGGKVSVNASTTIHGTSCEATAVHFTITGVPIPDATITERLKTLYDPEPGGTESICCGIASVESSYIQFKSRTLYGRNDRWPHESYDGGTHIGLMQVVTTFSRAWDWFENTGDGVDLYEANIQQSHNHVNNIRAQHAGLRDLTAVEHENNASSIYRMGNVYYYRWNGDEENPDWEVNTDNPTGVAYANEVRERAGRY